MVNGVSQPALRRGEQCRLPQVRHARRQVFLTLERHAVHRPAKVKTWLAANREKIALFLLPGYSPELNPDELLNQDVKSNALGRRRPANRTEMIAGLRSYLHSTQRHPQIVKNYFHADSVRYAEG